MYWAIGLLVEVVGREKFSWPVLRALVRDVVWGGLTGIILVDEF